jgi:hypothetical protein
MSIIKSINSNYLMMTPKLFETCCKNYKYFLKMY